MKTDNEIKAALDRASAMVDAKPAIGQRAYKSSAIVEGGLACVITEKEWRLAADLPASMGGDNGGPSPSTLFRAAVSSCVAMGVKMWAARLEAPIDRVEVTFDTDVDARGQFGVCDTVPAGFERARLTIDVISGADEGLVRKAVERSMRYSPLLDVIDGRFAVETGITIMQPQKQEQERIEA